MIDLNMFANAATAWAIRYLAVSTPLLLLLLVVTRLFPRLPHRLLDYLWRGTLIGSLAIATLLGLELQRPAIATFEVSLPGPAPVAAERDVPAAIGAEGLPENPGFTNAEKTAQPLHWPTILSALWIFGALSGLSLFALRRTLLYRRIGKRVPVMDGRVRELIGHLRREAKLAKPLYVSSSQDLYSPIAIGSTEICLPEQAINNAKDDELEGMIAHELAHLVRRDPVWLNLWNVAIAALFFQPLLLLARRRFQASAEYLCDSWAIQHTRRPEALVRCLVSVAEGFKVGAEHRLAVGMASSKRTLLDRARAALEEPHDNLRSKALLWGSVAVVAFFGAALVAPSIRIGTSVSVVEPMEPVSSPPEEKYPELNENESEVLVGEAEKRNSHSFIIYYNDLLRFLLEPGNERMPNPRPGETSRGVWRGGHHEIWDDLGLSYKAEIRGVVLTDDEQRIHHMEPDGYLKFRLETDDITYVIEIAPEDDRLVRRFWINATPMELQPQYQSEMLNLIDTAMAQLPQVETKPAKPTKPTKTTRATSRARSATRVNPNNPEPGTNVYYSTGNGNKSFVLYYNDLLRSVFDPENERQQNPLPGPTADGKWGGGISETQEEWSYRIRFRDVVLSEDRTRIHHIENRGYFRFTINIDGHSHRIEIIPTGGGELQRRYWRDGDEKNLNRADELELLDILNRFVAFSEERELENAMKQLK